MTDDNGFTEHMEDGDTFDLDITYDTVVGPLKISHQFTWGNAETELIALGNSGSYPDRVIADLAGSLYQAGEPSMVAALDSIDDEED